MRRLKNDHGGYDNDDENDDHDAMITVTMTTTMIMATPVTAAAALHWGLHRPVVDPNEDG